MGNFSVVDCGILATPPANGKVKVFGRTIDSVATYSCDDGYYLKGDSFRVCLENGLWSGSAPQCDGKSQIVSLIAIGDKK